MGETSMLKYFAIAAGIAALLSSFCVGYLFASTTIRTLKSNAIIKLENGMTGHVSYSFDVMIDITVMTAEERRKILLLTCAQAAQEIK
jgi:hypothetical protein